MSNFSLLAATRTIEKSMAFVLYRFALCFGTGLGFLFATLAGAGTFVGFGSLAKNASAFGPFGAVLGFAGFGYLLYKFSGYWLRTVQAPLLALLADQAKGKTLPTGGALVNFAKQRVADVFPSTASLSEQDAQVRAGLAGMVTAAAPAGGESLQTKALGFLFARNHQTILAWHFFTGGSDFQASAEAGLAAHQQNYSALLKYRLYATVFEVVGFIAAYPLLLIGIEKMVSGIPINMSFWPYLFAGVFSWSLVAAFFESISEAALLDAFLPMVPKVADPEPEAVAAPVEADAGEADA